ncbi:DNA cytosine methyltransferase [Aeromonas veronii]|uniref:DNA cytosine methyltransferase n=1 Tax=Aeromonas TaxID=642 RepID=UPI00207D2AAF|nr:DNA cytosine methyltransferase [Aeromonas veronii]MCO4173981.1 DNA cytosine methyltransferase [Aeromonas veronii]
MKTEHSNFIQSAYDLLEPLATEHTPEGTSNSAVVDQWLHAIALDGDFFAKKDLTSSSELKKNVISLLSENGLFSNREHFHNKIYAEYALKPDIDNQFKFIDLFAGIGGMRLGFQQNGGACVFSSEFDAKAQETYKMNHGEMPFGDITKINPADIPAHDILLAGFPCQPFSHAGLKLGIDDTRGTLFHNIANILEAKKPRFALLENVKGLISHDKGYTLQVVLRTLTKIGYSCNISKDTIFNGSAKEIQNQAKKMVLRSIDFGIPQNRQRIYIVLWRDGEQESFEYPLPTAESTAVGSILDKNPDPKLTISDRLWEGHQRRKIENKENGKGFGFGLVNDSSPYTNTISARYYKDGSEILIEQTGKNPRKLSPMEAARLQGFPEDFQPNKSNTQAYKQFGNSVSVPVIRAIAGKIVSKL